MENAQLTPVKIRKEKKSRICPSFDRTRNKLELPSELKLNEIGDEEDKSDEDDTDETDEDNVNNLNERCLQIIKKRKMRKRVVPRREVKFMIEDPKLEEIEEVARFRCCCIEVI